MSNKPKNNNSQYLILGGLYLIAFIPEILFIRMLLWFFGEQITFWSVLIGLIALNVFLLALWLFKAVFGWIVYFLWLKNYMSNMAYTNLVDNNFPRIKSEYIDSAETYFEEIILSDEHDCDMKIKASARLGAIEGLRGANNITLLIMTASATKQAIIRHNSEKT